MYNIVDVHRFLLDYISLEESPHQDIPVWFTTRTKRRLEKQKSSSHSSLYYLLLTSVIINKYISILAKPIRISFSRNTVQSTDLIDKEKACLRSEYQTALVSLKLDSLIDTEYTAKWNALDSDRPEKISDFEDNSIDSCFKCDSKNVIIQDAMHTCVECGVTSTVSNLESCFKDSERVNASSTYMHDRKAQFQICISNLLGRYTCTVPANVFKVLEAKMESHDLLIDSRKKSIRFSRISKSHIFLFLKESGFSKFYDCAPYIYSKLTNKKNISFVEIENFILDDFDKLLAEFDKLPAKMRSSSNFNNSTILYQFLRRYNVTVPYDTFTNKSNINDDDVLIDLFNKLNWTFYVNND